MTVIAQTYPEESMAKQKTKTGAPTEAAVRDYLAACLDMIEPGLALVETELKLPSPRGSHGFLDIFARDAAGKLVIVEIKRTRKAAREALQELYKYVALIRSKYLVTVNEYRVILLSVDWNDLLEAYSEFVPHAPFEVSAGRIVLGSSGLPERIDPVSRITNAAPRRFAVRHFFWGFPDQATADAAAGTLGKHFQKLGLRDFVLVRSRPTDPMYDGRNFLYFAQQELKFEEYDTLLKAAMNGDAYAEFQETINDYVELEDRVAEAADAIWSANGTPGRHEIGSDDMEIAYPEKARHWFNDIQQADVHVHRFGRFEAPWLTEKQIVSDLVGEGGASDFRLRYTARTAHRHEIDGLLKRIDNVFFYNPAWQGAAGQLVRYAERRGDATIVFSAFSNEDVLRTVAGLAFGYLGFMPIFRLDLTTAGKTESYFGLLEWDGTPFSFDGVVKKNFGGDPFSYFLAVGMGHNRQVNRDLLHGMGLSYGMFRQGKRKMERVRVQGSIVVTEDRPVVGFIPELIEKNVEEVGHLVAMFMETDQGFGRIIGEFVATQQADQELEALIAKAPRNDGVYWSGPIEHCDACGRSFADQRYMVDAIGFKGWGGANICSQCFVADHGKLGTGRGQAYQRDNAGWRIVSG